MSLDNFIIITLLCTYNYSHTKPRYIHMSHTYHTIQQQRISYLWFALLCRRMKCQNVSACLHMRSKENGGHTADSM